MRGARSAAARAYSALARSTRNFARSRRASGFCGASASTRLTICSAVASSPRRTSAIAFTVWAPMWPGCAASASSHTATARRSSAWPRELPAEGLRPVARLDVLAAVRQIRLLDQEAGERHVRRRRLRRGALRVFQLAHAVLVPLVVAETHGRQRPMERQRPGRPASPAARRRGRSTRARPAAPPAGHPRGPPRSPSRPARGPGRRGSVVPRGGLEIGAGARAITQARRRHRAAHVDVGGAGLLRQPDGQLAPRARRPAELQPRAARVGVHVRARRIHPAHERERVEHRRVAPLRKELAGAGEVHGGQVGARGRAIGEPGAGLPHRLPHRRGHALAVGRRHLVVHERRVVGRVVVASLDDVAGRPAEPALPAAALVVEAAPLAASAHHLRGVDPEIGLAPAQSRPLGLLEVARSPREASPRGTAPPRGPGRTSGSGAACIARPRAAVASS